MKDKEWAILAESLTKHFPGADKQAGLNGLDLRIKAGTIHGLLGPNGAGKTTALRIFTTLTGFDQGTVRVAGMDVRNQGRQIRERISLVGQQAAIDEALSARQNLVMFGLLNHLSTKQAKDRADELINCFSLGEFAGKAATKYSGGMRRRLDLAVGLIAQPEILFVDEPTTGLDPAARSEVWQAIKDLADSGTTILLTTQYLEEADRLADRISFIKGGRIVKEGEPEALKKSIGNDWIVMEFENQEHASKAILALASQHDPIRNPGTPRILRIPVQDRAQDLSDVLWDLRKAGIVPHDIHLHRPTLDEVFMAISSEEHDFQGRQA